jgi:hypothetical protein
MQSASKTQFNTGTKTKERQDERLFRKSILSSNSRDNNGGFENSSYVQSIVKPDNVKLEFNKSILSSDSRNEDGYTEKYDGSVNVQRQSLTSKTLSQLNKNLSNSGIFKAIRTKHETKYETKCEDSTVKASVCCGL